ncbi:hypothetical protein SARC_07929 [Sphaeroforma arctica JP610]|uniref:Uncharacterized protein n=1 Tax=Sphaeroforma arctica JP610 TaxID=667725 RepID=A0A0L0FSA6_9EUKA|nr:hypothetical protein SARC_07929 [Sphaeroforma arctica JP610]KNC79682.1 hypothetical protein SARC_07929 [Sphaeroforma arctica JP610]|eukprot:XP_014153584.1 hypothetical protein SARC_07929 [Sphaeroforma arctica JP610]
MPGGFSFNSFGGRPGGGNGGGYQVLSTPITYSHSSVEAIWAVWVVWAVVVAREWEHRFNVLKNPNIHTWQMALMNVAHQLLAPPVGANP